MKFSVVWLASVVYGNGGHRGMLSFHYSCSYSRFGLQNSRTVNCLSEDTGGAVRLRWQVLEQVDKELSKGDERAALSLVKNLQGKPGGLRCFDAARQVQLLKLNTIFVFFCLNLNCV